MSPTRWWVLLSTILMLGGAIAHACDNDGCCSSNGGSCPRAAQKPCSSPAACQPCCDCCEVCECSGSACNPLPQCTCPSGTKCVEGCCSDACSCGTVKQPCKCCSCGEECACKQKVSSPLPKCCCPPGTKCAEGCTPEACTCGKVKEGCSCGKKKSVRKHDTENEGAQKAFIGGCVIEVSGSSLPAPANCPLPRTVPPMMPMMMLLEHLCPNGCLPPPPPPPPGLLPASCPPMPCEASCCPAFCHPHQSGINLRHEADGIHMSCAGVKDCVCKKVSVCGPHGCLMLYEVKLEAGKDGSKVHIEAERLCLDPRTGQIHLDVHKDAVPGVVPAGFQFWSGFFN